MPPLDDRVAVQAHYLLAMSALVKEDDRAFNGVLIEPHPATGSGALLSATNGREIGLIYDAHGQVDGEPVSWELTFKAVSGTIAKVLTKGLGAFPGDIWFLLGRDLSTGEGKAELVSAYDAREALAGAGKSIATLQINGSGFTYDSLRPKVQAFIEGAAQDDRRTAPAAWCGADSMVAINEFASGLTVFSQDRAFIALLGTKRSNVVQVAVRDYDEAAAFVVTLKESGAIRVDNPGWLDVLL